MPSPVGHFLAGVAVSLAADRPHRFGPAVPATWWICGLLAASPDLDFLVAGTHRQATHSLPAVGIVLLLTWIVTRKQRGRWVVVAACTLAYGSHLLTDYFGVDLGRPAGIQLLWPWSSEWFISDWALFRQTERHDPLSLFAITMNALALAQELLVIGPITLFLWLRRRRVIAQASTPETTGGERRAAPTTSTVGSRSNVAEG